MSMTWYDADTYMVGVNADEVAQALGDLQRKLPATIKVAANATARETRKEMIRRAKERYAVNAKGREKINALAQRVKATNASPTAQLYIGGINGMRSDLAYFKHYVTTPHPGASWKTGPKVFRSKVLKSSGMHSLSEQGGQSKGFLAEFSSGHIGMISRRLGVESSNETTKNGHARWKSASSVIEKTKTYEAPSGEGMHHAVWEKYEIGSYAADVLQERLERQIAKNLAKAAAK